MKTNTLNLTALLVGSLLFSFNMSSFNMSSFSAHEGATGVVKERMDLMDTQKDAMKVLGGMAKGQVPFDAAKAAEAAHEIENTAAKIPDLFPEGTGGHPSEAKPEVWTQWEEFTADAEALTKAATALKVALEGDAPEWQAKFKGVVDACKTCHKTFRAEKKD